MYMYSSPYEDWTLNKIDNWNLKFCWALQRCFLSNKFMWGKWAYFGSRLITGPGEPVLDYRWIDRDEFILWKLKKG